MRASQRGVGSIINGLGPTEFLPQGPGHWIWGSQQQTGAWLLFKLEDWVTVLCTWSMVLQSDENLFRMLPRGVVSKNLRGNQRKLLICLLISFLFIE